MKAGLPSLWAAPLFYYRPDGGIGSVGGNSILPLTAGANTAFGRRLRWADVMFETFPGYGR